MSWVVVAKLLAIFAVIGVGWLTGRLNVLGDNGPQVLSAATFNVFTPALLFRTTAHIAIQDEPWRILIAYFGPTMGLFLLVYGWQRLRRRQRSAVPAVRALSMSFSNTVQLGIPVVTALFGAAGLAIHLSIVSLQSLVLLTTGTVLVEVSLRGGDGDDRPSTLRVIGGTVRRTVVHPVVLPVILGLAYNATGWRIPGPADDVLATLGQAVVPLSLVTIGLTLQHYNLAGVAWQAIAQAAGKVLVQPAVVLVTAYWGFGLRGLPLTVAVLCASLPIGANVLLFAQRYEVLEAETTAAIVASTTAFLVTGALWLFVLTFFGGR